MILQLSEKKIDVREKYLKSFISKSTQKELDVYEFVIKVNGKENFENFKRDIDKSKEELNEIDSEGKIIRKFSVKNWSYRFLSEYDEKEISYLCTIEIMQKEELYTKKIIIAGIENEVLKYKEEYDKSSGAIIIRTIIKTTEEQRDKINDLIKSDVYFGVKRPDISEKEIEMRFGKNIWSQHESYIKRQLILVEKKYDESNKNRKAMLWPELKNIQKMLVDNITYTLELEALLSEKNIITEEEKKLLDQKAEDRYKEIYRKIYLVEDVEKEWD